MKWESIAFKSLDWDSKVKKLIKHTNSKTKVEAERRTERSWFCCCTWHGVQHATSYNNWNWDSSWHFSSAFYRLYLWLSLPPNVPMHATSLVSWSCFFLRVHCTKALFWSWHCTAVAAKSYLIFFLHIFFLSFWQCFLPSNVFSVKDRKKGEKSPWDNSQILFSPVSTFYSNFFFKIQQLCTYI